MATQLQGCDIVSLNKAVENMSFSGNCDDIERKYLSGKTLEENEIINLDEIPF